MGADMILSEIMVEGDTLNIDVISRLQKFRKRIDKLTPAQITAAYKTMMEEDAFYMVPNGPTEAGLKEWMLDAIDDLLTKINGREVCYIHHCYHQRHFYIFITGGMSWGDDPTDTMQYFNKFNAIPESIRKLDGFS